MLSWVSVDARTGNVLGEFANLGLSDGDAVAGTMGRYESLTVSLPYPDSVIVYANDPANNNQISAVQDLTDWKTATRPGATVMVAIDELGNPTQGYLVLRRTRDETALTSLDMVTIEAYLDRRYVGAYTGTGIDQNQVFADLIDAFIADGSLPGLPIRVVNAASAQTQDVAYADTQDITVYSALTTSAGTLNGPQWTIKWEWQSSPQRITPVLYVADRLGTSKPADLAAPNALFNMPGCVQSFSVIEDYTAGKGANRVTAVTNGGADDREEDSENAANFLARPTFEFRYTPQASAATLQLTAAQHALAALAITQDGIKTISVTARVFGDDGKPLAPQMGIDCELGGDVAFDLMAPGFIDGELANKIGPMYGWQRTDTTLTVILYVQDVSAT